MHQSISDSGFNFFCNKESLKKPRKIVVSFEDDICIVNILAELQLNANKMSLQPRVSV